MTIKEDTATANLSEHLSRAAARLPDKKAVVCPAGYGRDGQPLFRSWTFRQLEEETDRVAHAFHRLGIGKGVRAILMVKPSFELFCLTFALLRVGAVPVLIDPGMGRNKLVANLSAIGAEAFIGIPLAHALRVLSPGAFSTVRVNVTVGRRLFWGGVRFDDLRRGVWRAFPPEPSRPEDLAGIFFTTGSTGPPKGVVYEHGMFDAQVRYLSSHFGYGENDVDLATFPLFAILDIVLGITSVIPDMDPTRPAKADPRKIVATLSAQGCNSLYGSPALLENLVRYGQATGATLPGLRRIITAGAPVRPALLEALHRMLPEDAVIHTPYGATEVLPVSSIDSREILEATREASEAGGGTCVGQPLAGMQVAIIGISEDPIDHWLQAVELSRREIGEIAVKGPVVTKEYFLRPEATRLAKIVDERDEGVWHRMGDVGYLDEWNRLWFCGRKTHRVEAPGRTLFTIPCEAVFNRHPRVRRSALVGIGRPGAQRPVMVIELAPGDKGRERDTLTAELLALGASCAHTKSIRTILYHPGFPVDIRHNAKIFREKLALWAEKTLAGRPAR